MRRALLVFAVLLAMAAPAQAQRVSAGAQFAFAAYAEQGSSLRFGGSGPSGHAAIEWRRFHVSLGAARLSFDPSDDSDAVEPFDMLHTEARLRVRATRLASVEAGFVHRDITPTHAAQSVASLRFGAVATFPLHIASDVSVRAAYLGGSKFSGGGSAPFGVEVGLGVSYAPWVERLRVTGDLEFQRLDRRIDGVAGRLPSPIQSTIARIGVAVTY